MYRSKALTEDTWNDFEKLFLKHKGVRGGCWCTYHQLPTSEYNRLSREERKALHYERVKEKTVTGLILYKEETPIGWCQFGSGDGFEQLNRNRAYKNLSGEKKLGRIGELLASLSIKPTERLDCLPWFLRRR